MYKAKQRMKTLLLACFAALVSMLLAVALWVTPTSKIDASAAEQTEEISLAGSTGTLAADVSSISWSGEYFTFTNTKGGTAIRTSDSDHYRVYAGSGITISTKNNETISKIVITCTSASYATVCQTSFNNAGHQSVTVSGSIVTIILANSPTSITATASAQTRFKTVAITYTEASSEPTCEHTNTTTTTVEATCTEAGGTTVTCNDCGETVSTTEIPATGHNYQGDVCSVCGEAKPNEETEELAIVASNGTLSNDTASISWTGTSIQVVNVKGSTAIRTSDSDHYRAYSGSKTTISTINNEPILKIVITCTDGYADELTSSIATSDASLPTSTSGNDVTITFATPVTEFTITATAQWRFSKVEVTYEPGCEHANTIETITKEPTCTETGSKTLTCTACANVEEVEISALGHNYDAGVVTPPTATDEGYTTYTCTRENCGHTYQDDFVPATGATMYTVSYSTPDGVADIASEEVAENFAHTLPIADAPDGYVFLGWVTTAYEASSNAPANIYAAESEYTVTENVTFYALYSWGEISWSLVTDAKKLAAGNEIVIVASGDSNFALGTDRGNNRNAAEITKNDNKVTVNDNVQIITLETGNVANTFAFNVGTDGYLYAASSSSNQLKTKTTLDNNGSWLIEIADDIATIKAQGTNTRNWLRFNSSNNPPIFSCYGSGQKDVSIYMKGGAVFYTTSLIEKDFDSASVSIDTDVKLNYYANISDVFENVEMQYYVVGNESEIFTAVGEKVDGRWKFTLNVAPQAMTDVFNASIVSNGIVLDTIEEYSVQKYAINQLANSPSDELKQLLTDMLHYGAAAQNYKGYNTESLATTGVDDIGTASDVLPGEECKSNLTTTKDLESYPAYFTGATVWFDGINKLRVYITTIDGASLSNVTLTINGEAVAVSGNMIETDGILATQFGETYTFVLSYDGTVMQTLTYSVNAYAYAKKADAEMGELALALYRYGVSAKAYAGA